VSGYELQAAVQDDVPRTLLFTGETQGFEFTGSNKTIIGTGNAVIRGGLSVTGGKKNTIFRNIKYSGGEDAIEVSGASCVWFDHIDAFDGSDGNLDIVRGSDLITVSWSRFYYVEKNHDHRLSNLNGNKPGDTPGKIRVTFHHNWWGEKVLQRMPRVRHGKVHVFNNYYSTKEAQYFVGLSDSAQLLVEHNWAEFRALENPIMYFDSPESTMIKLVDNHWAEGVPVIKGKEGGWDPPYEYKLDAKEYAKAAVMKWAGPDDKKFGN
jgi:pectate lyase